MATSKKKTASKGRTSAQRYETLHDLFILKLWSLHDVESQLIKALPKMAKAATNAKLREAFSNHLEETKVHEERIDRALEILGDSGKGKSKVEAIRGLVKDAEWLIKSIKSPAARDVALIAAAQYVEHYEIAGYGAAATWADQMGHTEVLELLEATLDEEEAADETLSTIAETSVNADLDSGMGEEQSNG